MNPKNLRGGIAALIVLFAGCAKKEEPVVRRVPEVPRPESVELVKAQERSRHFAAVNRQLELGGTLYGYVDVDGDAEKIAGTVHQVLAQIAKTQPALRPAATQDFKEIFGLVGLNDIEAAGVSSVDEGNGFFRNRVFLYTPQGRHGLLAALGGAAGPFTHLNLAPADTDVYAEAEMDLPVLYTTVKAVVAKISGEAASSQLDATLTKAGQGAALSVLDLIYGLKGHSALVLRLDPERTLRLPVPPTAVVVPSFSFLICVDGVGGVLDPMFAKTPALKRTEAGTQHIYESAQPLPLQGLQPVFVVDGSTLYIATSREFLNQCLTQKSGLAEDAEFRTALAAVGTQGNGLAYVHPRFFQRVQQIETLNPQLPEETKATLHLLLTNFTTPAHPLVAIRTNLPDGILIRSHWDRSLKKDLAVLSVYNPLTVGVLAAMAIPSFQKVRSASQEKAVLNNLRMFTAAGDQYCLEQGVQQATYANLVGPGKYIKVLTPVAGEDYRGLVYRVGKPLRVRLGDGRPVQYGP